MIDRTNIKGKSVFAIAARNNPNDRDLWIAIVESYRDGGTDGKEHLEYVFGKRSLIRLHEEYLNIKFNERN